MNLYFEFLFFFIVLLILEFIIINELMVESIIINDLVIAIIGELVVLCND